jgi:hypothetical protein
MKIKFLLVLFAAPLALQAQQDSTVLNAQEAVRIALEKNLNIKIVQEDLTIAKINNTWGNAGRWPTITAFIQPGPAAV